MSKTAIVTTSINAQPIALKHWAEQGDLFVAGDVNTPDELREYVERLDGVYIPPYRRFPGGLDVPLRSIQMRNAAIWRALEGEYYDHIITVDDDNTPVSSQFVELLTGELGHQPRTTVGSKSGFLNLGNLCIPTFVQRGTPRGFITAMDNVRHWSDADYENRPPTVVVAQAMVIGDPDCDAIERLTKAPVVSAVQNRIVVTPGVYAAFNSQATAWMREWAPVMAVMPFVGRYDDIFASLIFHRMAKEYHVALYAGDPVVKQDRNDHDLVKDLRAEVFGMNIVLEFCARLNAAHIHHDMPLWLAYDELIAAVADLLPHDAVRFLRNWISGWRAL